MMVSENEIVGLLKRLIAINSENPGNNEIGVVDYCRSYLTGLGFNTNTIFSKNRPNLIATFGEKNHGPKIVLNGHADTKPAIDPNGSTAMWNTDPFKGHVDGDRLYGLGSADMKGGLASALVAVKDIVKGHRLSGCIAFHIVADEEMASRNGMRYISNKHPGALHGDFAIVLEPTDLKIANAHVGNIWLDFTLSGKGGHAGNPHALINPIEKSMEFIQILKSNIARYPYPTFSVGKISSGFHPGSIPDQATFTADMRIPPLHERANYITNVIRHAKSFEKHHNVKISIKGFGPGGLDPSFVPDNNQYLQVLQECTKSDFVTLSGGTDASFYNKIGTDAVVYGPGSLAQAHQPNEYTKISQLVSCTKQLQNFLRRTVL